MNSNFIDHIRIFCASGAGGNGSAHLRRAKYNPKGGPDGGDGGRGGDVIIRCDSRLWTLIHLKYTRNIRAEDGRNGSRNTRNGKSGANVYVDVPVGTVIKDSETGKVLFELDRNGEERVLCKGGQGGLGNDNFKSPTNRTPREFTFGEPAQEGRFIFELKILADVGLVGLPNAGKSTLLSAVSAARPQIADYPFTTLVPQLGIVPYRGRQSFAMADIPGIIEGAHEGRGLGIRFLRHIERNSVLLFCISCTDDAGQTYRTLLKELQAYSPELLDKRRVVAITKCDLQDPAELYTKGIRRALPPGLPTVFISSVTGLGINALKEELWKALNVSGSKQDKAYPPRGHDIPETDQCQMMT